MIIIRQIPSHKATPARIKKETIKIVRELSRAISKGTNEWGRVLEKDMKNSARDSNIQGNTIYGKGIRYEQRPLGKTGRLKIYRRYQMLDNMRPHWVSITNRRTRLLRWATQARSQKIKNAAQRVIKTGQPHSIYVRPHPFIQNGFNRAKPKIRPILAKNIQTELLK